MEEKSIFLEIVGDTPKLRVLDFLITYSHFDYGLVEISKNSQIAYKSLQTFWLKFVEAGIVKKTRRVGKSDMYQLNTESPAVRQLMQFYWQLTKGQVHKALRKPLKISA